MGWYYPQIYCFTNISNGEHHNPLVRDSSRSQLRLYQDILGSKVTKNPARFFIAGEHMVWPQAVAKNGTANCSWYLLMTKLWQFGGVDMWRKLCLVLTSIHVAMVGGFKHELYVPSYGWDVILPIDELIFFKMVIAPPTSYIFGHLGCNMFVKISQLADRWWLGLYCRVPAQILYPMVISLIVAT